MIPKGDMVFLILDSVFFATLIAMFILSLTLGYKRIFGNRLVFALCLVLLLRYTALFYYHRDFIAGCFAYLTKDYAQAQAKVDRHLADFPASRLLRRFLHFEAGKGICREISARDISR